MNNQSTPETDLNECWPASNLKLGDSSVVPAKFARKLERERDEARSEVEKLQDALMQIKNSCVDFPDTFDVFEKIHLITVTALNSKMNEQPDTEKPVYEWKRKLDSGEYLYEWNGYSPHFAGSMYGSSVCLGGEEKFYHCHDFFSGIGDVSWWIKEELDKLTTQEQEELLFILKRNKSFDEYMDKIVPELAKILNVRTHQIYRVKNKTVYDFLNLIHAQADFKDLSKGNYYEQTT